MGAPSSSGALAICRRIVDSAEAALMQGHHDILFQRGPQVVRVVRQQAMSVRTFKRPAGGLGISVVDKNYLVEELTRAAAWEKYDSRSESWKAMNAPDIVAQTYLARTGHWKLPRLLSVISAPTLRPDGSILQQPGYDATRRRGTTRAGWNFRRYRRSRPSSRRRPRPTH
jgi:putative DNA primase/helicase